MSLTATVGELVVQRPSRARVFERFGIDYCCGGKLPLADVCRKKGIDPQQVLAALDQEDAGSPPSIVIGRPRPWPNCPRTSRARTTPI